MAHPDVTKSPARGRPRSVHRGQGREALLRVLVWSVALTPAIWVVVGCGVNDDRAANGMAQGARLEGTDLWAAVEGNDVAADRINLVFAPWGWDDQSAFEAFVASVLSWDGRAFQADVDGRFTNDPDAAARAELGLFAIEPWRSRGDLFNVWYTDQEPVTPVAWLAEVDPPFQLTDMSVVTIALDAHRFNPELTSVAGQDVVFHGPDDPERPAGGDPFANAVVVIDGAYPVGGVVDLPHELGHALFNLPDEYGGQVFGFDGRSDLSSWPSCAEDEAEARHWWGDLDGDVDPMVSIWIEEMTDAGFPFTEPRLLDELVRVGLVEGGCYGVAGSVRATEDSLMNTSIPVLGSVNRGWAEKILDLWEGAPR